MRTDVKIGIAVGLFLAVLAVLYFFVFSTGAPPEEGEGDQLVRRDDRDERFGAPEEGPSDGGTEVIVPRFGEDDPLIDEPEEDDEPLVPRFERETSAVPDGPVEPEVDTEPDRERPFSITPIVPPEDRPSEPRSESPYARREREPGERERPIEPLIPRRTPTPRTYTVKEGDAGFWAVSENVYGNGKHWPLIAEANPDADSSSLRAGQTLTIPPLPERTTPERRTPRTFGGEETYTVQEGDAGFWGIAAKVYGNGKYWPLLAEANPDLDSSKLRAGQVLVVPERTEETPSVAGGRTAPRRQPRAGETTYTVQAGDAGFWAVAKNAYGNGAYWPAVAEANPGVDPQRLQVGQTLIVPELTAADRERIASRAPSGAAGRTAAGAEETAAPMPEGYITPPPINMSP